MFIIVYLIYPFMLILLQLSIVYIISNTLLATWKRQQVMRVVKLYFLCAASPLHI